MTITPRETGSILDGEAAAPSAASVGTAGHSAPVEGDIRARSTVGVGYHHSRPSDQPTPDSREADPVTGAAMHVHGLTLYYGDKPALKDISLSIPPRRITALIGPSGSGKTSLLNCLNRLIDLTPAARVDGRVDLDGSDIRSTDTDVISLRRRVGMIFQKPAPFPLSIRRNIELPLIDHGLRDRSRRREMVETVLRDVGLWDEVKDRLTAPALSLSGGQQQRLCIARALALRPEVILFDEPCSALDPLAGGVVEDLIIGLAQRYTVVIVTHNLAQARRIADLVGLLWVREDAGRLIEFGPVKQIFENPQHELTAAYIRGLRG